MPAGVGPAGVFCRGGTGWGVLPAAGLVFFAFAGSERLALMGRHMRRPERNIGAAILGSVIFTLVLYLLLSLGLLRVLGPTGVADTATPMLALVRQASGVSGGSGQTLVASNGAEATASMTSVAVSAAAALAALGALLALLPGTARAIAAMAREADLPSVLARTRDRSQLPLPAELCVVAVVIAVLFTKTAISVLAAAGCALLVSYAVANLAALTLPGAPAPRILHAVGLAGCLLLACMLPIAPVLAVAALLAAGMVSRFAAVVLKRVVLKR